MVSNCILVLEEQYLSYLRYGYGHSYIFKPLSLTRDGEGETTQLSFCQVPLVLEVIFVYLTPAADSHSFGFQVVPLCPQYSLYIL